MGNGVPATYCGSQPNTFVMFFLNLGQTGLFKPMQGWYARLYTALGLGVIAAAGVWHVYESSIDYNPYWRLGIPAALALGFGWLIFRIVHFQPFAEFLIATEAEMNKVSWPSRGELFRWSRGRARRISTARPRSCSPRSCSWRSFCSWWIGSGCSFSAISASSSSPEEEASARPPDWNRFVTSTPGPQSQHSAIGRWVAPQVYS